MRCGALPTAAPIRFTHTEWSLGRSSSDHSNGANKRLQRIDAIAYSLDLMPLSGRLQFCAQFAYSHQAVGTSGSEQIMSRPGDAIEIAAGESAAKSLNIGLPISEVSGHEAFREGVDNFNFA